GRASSRTVRTSPSVRRGGTPRRVLWSAREGSEVDATINTLYGIGTRCGIPGRSPDSFSGRLLDRVGCQRRAAALARRLGGRAGRRRGALGPRRLLSLAGGKRREGLPFDQGRDLLAVENLVLQERLGDAHQRFAVGLDH